MSDEIDATTEREQFLIDKHIEEISRKAALIPKGEPGDCRYCGETFTRLVYGVCGGCRDARHLE